MTIETTAPGTGTAGSITLPEPPAGQLPAAPTTPPEPPTTPASTAEVTPEVQKLIDAALSSERKEAAKMRTELKKLTDAQTAAENANLSEVDRLKKENEDLKTSLADVQKGQQSDKLRMATVSAAARLRFADVDDAHRLLDASAVEYDETGKATNVEKLLGDLVKAKPYLVAQGNGAAPDWTGSGQGKSTLTRAQIEKMTPDEINKNWAQIQEAMARGI